ncbi:MAG: hypothetical protein LLG97_19385 [Deltaproteobacteria bacterium]|nr:hypothetical protein [Deltaproteobacteria bacterium]
MSTRQDYITTVQGLVPGDYPQGETSIILAIGQAIKEYSKHRPRVVPEDEAGAGAFDYAVTLFAEWSQGFSLIQQVEYPVDDTDPEANVLDEDAWKIYSKPSGDCLRFLEDEPAVGETFRVTYTTLHTCTDAACTVSAIDEEAVETLAAAHYCEILATWFSQSQDSTFEADVVNHTSKARDFAARARAFREIYRKHLGLKENDTVPAAAAVGDMDLKYPGGGERLTHPRSERKKR